MWLPLRCRPALSSMMTARHFHNTAQVWARQNKPKHMPLPRELLEFTESSCKFKGDDIPSGAHLALDHQRQIVYYLRLIENEMPKLVAFRKPFIPPTPASPLVIRSVDYSGEDHPITIKRTVVVPVAHLPMRNDLAIHTVKLLAGARWTPDPPKNAGVTLDSEEGKHGYIKIACEDFPHATMNLKWISDTIDKLVAKANDKTPRSYQDLPLDMRHVEAKVKKAKMGDHTRGRTSRPSLKDFPKEWLPQLPVKSSGVTPRTSQ
ncbi:mitochondrial ribosomal subunit protein-domain-containing protein [Melanogaster broomeanus]|nr:mitochondrial ribosomal subunit protein-domain-containing protein [Melanogaster broomeanus]